MVVKLDLLGNQNASFFFFLLGSLSFGGHFWGGLGSSSSRIIAPGGTSWKRFHVLAKETCFLYSWEVYNEIFKRVHGIFGGIFELQEQILDDRNGRRFHKRSGSSPGPLVTTLFLASIFFCWRKYLGRLISTWVSHYSKTPKLWRHAFSMEWWRGVGLVHEWSITTRWAREEVQEGQVSSQQQQRQLPERSTEITWICVGAVLDFTQIRFNMILLKDICFNLFLHILWIRFEEATNCTCFRNFEEIRFDKRDKLQGWWWQQATIMEA